MCRILIPLISSAGLDSLDSLILGHNQLKEVPARVFSHLTLLNSLEMDGNHITHIHPEAFLGLEGLYNQVSYSLNPVFVFVSLTTQLSEE
jgi:Leucine-rich repeat (LRR) protein